MKDKLVDQLFKEFEKDKKTIKQNLLQVMNTIVLESKDKYGSLTMNIHYERNDKNV